MTELETNLNNILLEKQNKILPQNIKEGVHIFDVIGTLREKDDAEAIALVNEINGEII